MCRVDGEGGTGRLPPSETRLESVPPSTASSPASARATRVGVGLANGMGMPNNDGGLVCGSGSVIRSLCSPHRNDAGAAH